LNKPTTLLHDGSDGSGRLEQAVTVLVGLFVFLNPFPHTTALKEATFYLPLAGMLYLAFSKKKDFSWTTPLALPFALLAAWGAAGLFFAVDRPNTIHDLLSHLLKYYAVYFLVVQFYPSQKGFDTLARIIVASTAIFSVGAIVYFYPVLGHAFSERLGHSKQYSFYEMSANYMCFPTVLAAILAFNLLLKEKTPGARILAGTALVAVLAATLLTQTRGALIALAACIVVLVLHNRKRLIIAVAGFIVVATILVFNLQHTNRLSPKNYLYNERIELAQMYMEMIRERPVMGIGFGMEILQNLEFMRPYYHRLSDGHREEVFHVSPHNLYLDVTVRTGIIGLLIYLGIIMISFHMIFLSMRRARDEISQDRGLCMIAAWSACLIQAFFADASFGVPAIVFYLNLAMITILWRENCEIGTVDIEVGPGETLA
jgi:O-antigen ligase